MEVQGSTRGASTGACGALHKRANMTICRLAKLTTTTKNDWQMLWKLSNTCLSGI